MTYIDEWGQNILLERGLLPEKVKEVEESTSDEEAYV